MAGRGPSPKDADRRARRNQAPAMRIVVVETVPQPPLPTMYLEDDEGKRKRFAWPKRTQDWWQMWADSPLSDEFTSTDWSELLDTALLHARFWRGDKSVAAELRLRAAKFGATPEDRARLRIQFAAADKAESDDDPKPGAGARRRHRELRLVDEDE